MLSAKLKSNRFKDFSLLRQANAVLESLPKSINQRLIIESLIDNLIH